MADISNITFGSNTFDIRDKKAILIGSGAPISSTTGTVGQLYENTTNGLLYICKSAIGGVYTWEQIGGSGVTDVQVDGVSVVSGGIANIEPTVESGNSTDYLLVAQSGSQPDPSPTTGKDTIVLYTDSSAGVVNNVTVDGVSVVNNNVAEIDTSNLAKLDSLSYSTSEQDTGKTWINGHKIYSKTIDFGYLPNTSNSPKKVNHNIQNLEQVVDWTGMCHIPNGTAWWKLPITSIGIAAQTAVDITTTTVDIYVNTDHSAKYGYVTIYYTKNS